ncbi:hypothetical protein Taro_047369 [Colocasia esculenta]|uniref:Uncharacterized protein n=1 Tax=Colocasia esculenta TaxID=4460 RepID=A0A843X0Q5_COLES|nr:hypothetical protein [Colocasia esculenta]
MFEGEGDDWVLVRRPTEAEMMASSGGEEGAWSAAAEEQRPLKIVFTAPAAHWTDAAPIGNGSLGAMVWGDVPTETLQLNRDIKLEFDESHGAHTAYERELDIDTAMVKVKYTVGDVEFTREHFSSNPHKVIVTKISASKPASVSFTVSLDSKLHHHSSVNSVNQIVLEGSCPGKRISPRGVTSGNPRGIMFYAILDLQISDDAGLVQVEDGRKLRVEGSNWAVLLLVASSSFDGPFTDPSDSKKDPATSSISTLNAANKLSYSQLYAYHLNDYQELFHRVTLRLSKSSTSKTRRNEPVFSSEKPVYSILDSGFHLSAVDNVTSHATDSLNELGNDALISTAERVKSFRLDEDPTLVELLFQYGRYLLISCSRPGTQVANLQGIWSKDLEPPWDAAQHLNINLQMNYWPSLSCNLSECQEPLFDYISSLSISGSKTAKVNYECSGWVAHQISDLWGKTSADFGATATALNSNSSSSSNNTSSSKEQERQEQGKNKGCERRVRRVSSCGSAHVRVRHWGNVS